MKDAATITVLTGPPGSGKTTIAGALADTFPRSAHVEGDWFWRWVRSGFVLPWLPESHDQNVALVAIMARSAAAYADAGYAVVLDAMLGPWMLDEFLAGLDGHRGAVRYVVLRPDVEVAVRRAVARGAPDLVEEEPVRIMHAKFADLGRFEPFAVDNTGLDPAETVALLGRRLASGRHDLPRP